MWGKNTTRAEAHERVWRLRVFSSIGVEGGRQLLLCRPRESEVLRKAVRQVRGGVGVRPMLHPGRGCGGNVRRECAPQ